MQKVIIPALALLIGMALGALLMQNSANSLEAAIKNIEIVLETQKDNSIETKDGKFDFNGPGAVESEGINPEHALVNLYSKLQRRYLTLSCNETQSTGINIEEAENLLEAYYSRPLYKIKNRCDLIQNGDCEANDMAGWQFDRKSIDILLDSLKTADFDALNFYLARRPSEKNVGALTLVMIPSRKDTILAYNKLIFEYARPCPPKCKVSIIGDVKHDTIDCGANPLKEK